MNEKTREAFEDAKRQLKDKERTKVKRDAVKHKRVANEVDARHCQDNEKILINDLQKLKVKIRF